MTTTTLTDPTVETFSLEQLGAVWDMHPASIRALIARGELRASRLGRQIRIRKADAAAYLDATVIGGS